MNDLKEKLEIILVTYNRKKYLERTLQQLFDKDSPVKNLSITVLDNNSDDGTSELLQEYAFVHPNLTHLKNNRNIGGNGNIAKAFEMAKLPYLWILCDDDTYDWTNFYEIEKAIEDDYDLIYTTHIEGNPEHHPELYFIHATFVPCAIHKTKNLTSTVMENMMCNIVNLFPHLAPVAKCLNENKRIFNTKEYFVHIGKENYNSECLYRGVDATALHPYRQSVTWTTSLLKSALFIQDEKLRNSIVENTRTYGKNLFEHLIYHFTSNKLCGRKNSKGLIDMFYLMNFKHRIILLSAYFYFLVRYLCFKNIFCPSLRSKENFAYYFEKIEFAKRLKKLKRKYKHKKILFYGAGMMFEAINENYDLSELNIEAISDKKFEKEQCYLGYKAVPPSKIKDLKPDVIFVSMYNINLCKKLFEDMNIKYEYLAKVPPNFYMLIETF